MVTNERADNSSRPSLMSKPLERAEPKGMTDGAHTPIRRASLAAPRTWMWPDVASALPTGLPCGVLTLLQIGDADTPGDWASSVQELLRAVRNSGHPVAYVPVDHIDQPAGSNLSSTEGFGWIDDDDHTVTGCDHLGRPYSYRLNLPTLDAIAAPLEAYESRHGNALLVLDGVERARPYWPSLLNEGPIRFPDGLTLTPRALDAWRANDLACLAASRGHAPTIAVWRNSLNGGEEALKALADRSQIIVTSRLTRGRPMIEVHRQS